MRWKSKERENSYYILLKSGRLIHYRQFAGNPVTVGIDELHDPPLEPDELEDFADELKGLAGELRAKKDGIQKEALAPAAAMLPAAIDCAVTVQEMIDKDDRDCAETLCAGCAGVVAFGIVFFIWFFGCWAISNREPKIKVHATPVIVHQP